MTVDDLRQRLFVDLADMVVVDIQPVEGAPGSIRVVTVRRNLAVSIEYEPAKHYSHDEMEGPELKYTGSYPSIELLVADLEAFFERPISEWRDHARETYATTMLEQPDWEANRRYFEDLVRRHAIRLPEHGEFEIASIYYQHIDIWGEYRPDRLGEEMEIRWRRKGLDLDEDDDDDDLGGGSE